MPYEAELVPRRLANRERMLSADDGCGHRTGLWRKQQYASSLVWHTYTGVKDLVRRHSFFGLIGDA